MPSRVPSHRPARLAAPSRHRTYDATARNAESKRFYDSSAWRKLRAIKLGKDPACESCLLGGLLCPAIHVHHLKPIETHPHLRRAVENLQSLCHSCHSRLHASEASPGQ